ncbi:MAG: tRNA pseudouridine(55) synthase TruB [Lachnospiraceae bacterium]|nr:tRNA pseudouridine(55) synthase TruB [Lachnospiraceae bacterium]
MINGLINVYKEKGYTSFDVVAILRGISGQRKIGHTGTLDPDATGVLPIALGNATKLCDMLTDKSKEYVATFMLGKRTDTLDISGTVLEQKEVTCTPKDIEESIKSFIGGYDQIPPMFSAKWVNGQRLYDLARKGREVERQPVFVNIENIEIVSIELPIVKIRVLCGKGTYIRSLCEDIAKKCGELAVMTELERTRVMCFDAESAYKISDLEKLRDEGRLLEAVTPTDSYFYEFSEVKVLENYRKAIDNGNKLYKKMVKADFKPENGQIVRVYRDCGKFMGLYTYNSEEGSYSPYKMFIEPKED